jgi:hypothetical protein
MKTRLSLAQVLFWLHVAIVTSWFVLFLVPLSTWPDRITFQFYFAVLIVGHQALWGLMIMPWSKKFRMVCILTTLQQLLSRQKLSDSKNYEHIWLKKQAGDNRIKISHKLTTILTFFFFILITILYLLQLKIL